MFDCQSKCRVQIFISYISGTFYLINYSRATEELCEKTFACPFYCMCLPGELRGLFIYSGKKKKNYISTCCPSRILGFCQNSPLIICWHCAVEYNKGLWECFNTSVITFIQRAISGQGAYPLHSKDCGFCSHGNDRQFTNSQQYKIITLAWSWADILPLPERIILMNC